MTDRIAGRPDVGPAGAPRCRRPSDRERPAHDEPKVEEFDDAASAIAPHTLPRLLRSARWLPLRPARTQRDRVPFEVIVPAYTFPVPAKRRALRRARGWSTSMPTRSTSTRARLAAVTPRTRAVIAVHLFGRPVDVGGVAGLGCAHRRRRRRLEYPPERPAARSVWPLPLLPPAQDRDDRRRRRGDHRRGRNRRRGAAVAPPRVGDAGEVPFSPTCSAQCRTRAGLRDCSSPGSASSRCRNRCVPLLLTPAAADGGPARLAGLCRPARSARPSVRDAKGGHRGADRHLGTTGSIPTGLRVRFPGPSARLSARWRPFATTTTEDEVERVVSVLARFA